MSTKESITAILADTRAAGFRFLTEVVKADGRGFPAEIPQVEDLAKFDENFPGVALRAINGQSIRVGAQAVCRAARGSLKPEALRERVVKWLLGIDEPTVKTVYAGPNGEAFATEEEAKNAWHEYAASLQSA